MIAEIGSLKASFLLVYNLARFTRGGVAAFWVLFSMLRDKGVRIFNFQSGQIIDEDNAASALTACIEASQAKASNI